MTESHHAPDSRRESPGEADLRIVQANERTLLAWVRTGLTLMAFGFVVARLTVWLRVEHPDREGSALGTWLGIGIVALGVACHILGARRFVVARRAILEGRPMEPGAAGPLAIALAVAAAGIGAIAYLAQSAT
jgi:putative membrane protein